MLNIESSIVLIIDIQERLLNAVFDKNISNQTQKLTNAATTLDIPIIATEQYPKGLGNTMPDIAQFVNKTIEKTSFSAFFDIKEELETYNKKQVILCGIEGHICVYQTAIDLLKNGYDVHIMKDGTCSRNQYELDCAYELLKNEGAKLTCLEIILFEWLKSSKNPHFKAIQQLIK